MSGANLYHHFVDASTPYLRWIDQIRHMPEMNWLNNNPYAKYNILNQLYLPHSYNNFQSISPYTENYCFQQPHFYTYRRRFSYQKPVQLNILRPYCLQKIVPPRCKYIQIIPQQRRQQQQRKLFSSIQKAARIEPIHQWPLDSNQKLQPMMCNPLQSQQELATFKTKETKKKIAKNFDDLIPEDYERDDVDEHPSFNDIDDEIFHQPKNMIRPKAKFNENLNSRQIKDDIPQATMISHPKSETMLSKAKTENNDVKQKTEPYKKKRRRRRRRGPRINKKIGRTLLKGLHVAEDLAASGALGPEMKAVAIAAESAETAIKGAIKGESAAEIMKQTAMTAASAAVGGSMKAQMMTGLAAQSGLPVPPVATTK